VCGSFLPVLNPVVIPVLRAGTCCAVLRGSLLIVCIDLFSCKAASVFTINLLTDLQVLATRTVTVNGVTNAAHPPIDRADNLINQHSMPLLT